MHSKTYLLCLQAAHSWPPGRDCALVTDTPCLNCWVTAQTQTVGGRSAKASRETGDSRIAAAAAAGDGHGCALRRTAATAPAQASAQRQGMHAHPFQAALLPHSRAAGVQLLTFPVVQSWCQSLKQVPALSVLLSRLLLTGCAAATCPGCEPCHLPHPSHHRCLRC